ncbi:MAG TPA: hypothetical protein VFA07_16800 [Chthonomonadaceae bacterium]|nr:hypothetical protein [Chthonomonadaceae bacterium]
MMEYLIECLANPDATTVETQLNTFAQMGWRLITIYKDDDSHLLHMVFERDRQGLNHQTAH